MTLLQELRDGQVAQTAELKALLRRVDTMLAEVDARSERRWQAMDAAMRSFEVQMRDLKVSVEDLAGELPR